MAAEQLISSFWQGFAAALSTLRTGPSIIEAYLLDDGTLYIKKAPAALADGVLEVGSPVILTYDGVEDGKEVYSGLDVSYVKISDKVYDLKNMVRAVIRAGETTLEATEITIDESNGCQIAKVDGFAFAVSTYGQIYDGDSGNSITATPGTYMVDMDFAAVYTAIMELA